MHDGGRIHRLTLLDRGLEMHFAGGNYGSLIKSVTEAANYTIHMQLTAGSEHDFEENFTLDF